MELRVNISLAAAAVRTLRLPMQERRTAPGLLAAGITGIVTAARSADAAEGGNRTGVVKERDGRGRAFGTDQNRHFGQNHLGDEGQIKVARL
jgi:hypothetical protein